jgi:hypothetical protein
MVTVQHSLPQQLQVPHSATLAHLPACPSCPCLQVWLDDCRAAFSALTSDKQTREAAEAAAESAKSYAQPDDLIDFGHLVSNRKGGLSQLELEDQVGGECLGGGSRPCRRGCCVCSWV